MGLLHAAFLSQVAGTTVLVRRAEHAQAIQRHGITTSTNGNIQNESNVVATTSFACLDAADLVMVAVKSYDTKSVAQALANARGTSSAVVSLQNGFGHDELLVKACGINRILLGKTGYGARRIDDTTVEVTGSGTTVLGERNGVITSRVTELVALLASAGAQTEPSDNMNAVLWTKFAQACCQNVLSAVTGLSFGEMYKRQDVVEMLRVLAAEMSSLARAQNVPMLHDLVPKMLQNWQGRTHRSSMLQDLEAGRRTEIDALNAEAVRLGEKVGVDMPANRKMWMAIRAREEEQSWVPRKPTH